LNLTPTIRLFNRLTSKPDMKSYIRTLVPESFVLFYHKLKAILAAYYFGFPSRQIKVIGITGTDGKTTTCNIIAKILEEDGHKVGLATTINFQIGKKKWVNETKMTTLSAWDLQSLLARMVQSKCKYAIIETSSHALVQHRTWGIDYDIVGITNVTREHLDYHKTMEEYMAAKELLFKQFAQAKPKKGTKKVSIVNLQDTSWRKMIKYPAKSKYGYSANRQSKLKLKKYPDTTFIYADDIALSPNHSSFTLHTPKYSKKIRLNLLGKHNIQNSLLAICVARSQRIKLKIIKSALEKIKQIPGRFERVDAGQPFSVFIDYAVTPNALEKLYRDTIKPIAQGKIIAVFGACGDRDQGKRPLMGEIVSQYADKIILTHEDSWTEDPLDIINMIKPGVEKNDKIINQDYYIIENRQAAIKKAISLAQPSDIVVITGKGAETKMVYPDQTIDWNEKEIITELLTKN